MNDAAFWIEHLDLKPHPEGGYFRETYRATETIAADALPPRFGSRRAVATAIYHLLTRDAFSALHRFRADELWHFYAGDALTITMLDADGVLATQRLGRDLARGEAPQATVPAGAWLGAEVEPPGTFTLVGCTVAPGFDYADFELGVRAALVDRYPQHRAVITRLTR